MGIFAPSFTIIMFEKILMGSMLAIRWRII